MIHRIDPLNATSIALATRLGSKRLRTAKLPLPTETMEVDIYGQSRERWMLRTR